MFKKYNDTPAAIAMGLVTLFFIFQVGAFFFGAEAFNRDGYKPLDANHLAKGGQHE